MSEALCASWVRRREKPFANLRLPWGLYRLIVIRLLSFGWISMRFSWYSYVSYSCRLSSDLFHEEKSCPVLSSISFYGQPLTSRHFWRERPILFIASLHWLVANIYMTFSHFPTAFLYIFLFNILLAWCYRNQRQKRIGAEVICSGTNHSRRWSSAQGILVFP